MLQETRPFATPFPPDYLIHYHGSKANNSFRLEIGQTSTYNTYEQKYFADKLNGMITSVHLDSKVKASVILDQNLNS